MQVVAAARLVMEVCYDGDGDDDDEKMAVMVMMAIVLVMKMLMMITSVAFRLSRFQGDAYCAQMLLSEADWSQDAILASHSSAAPSFFKIILSRSCSKVLPGAVRCLEF